MIHINDIISERYKVQAVIGHGGMSDVYEARDIIFKRIVALKILKEEAAKKDAAQAKNNFISDLFEKFGNKSAKI